MKQFTVIVKPFRAEAVLKAAADFGVLDCMIREAKGYSRQKGYLDRYRGSEYSAAYLPKVEITVWVTDSQAAELSDKLPKVARTGRIGDGKVFVSSVEEAIRIRTGEDGEEVLQAHPEGESPS